MAFGVVMFQDQIIGSFRIDGENKLDFEMNDKQIGFDVALEFATEQGVPLGLLLNPDFDKDSDV